MFIIPEYKFCFLASPRTGSKTIAKILIEKYDAILVGSHHSTPDEHPEYEFDYDWLICSAIRNNWDTMISWWFRAKQIKPLAEFLPYFCENNSNIIQNQQLWWRNMPFTRKVLRYEWLNTDFDHALVAVGLPPVNLPVITDSKRSGRPYQIFYKSATVKWVARYFKKEIEKYGYKF